MMTSPTSAPRLDRAGAWLLVSGDDAGRWDLDGQFVLLTADGERFRVNGWCCSIETGVSA